MRLAISHVCLIPGESPDELQAQQYSLHDFRGSIAGQAEVSRLSKVILSIPGCLLKIPWEVSRIKGHSDSLPNLNEGEKKKLSFYLKR